MQLLDNANAEPRHQVDSTHWAGCLYSVDCIGSNSKPNPFGQWNKAKIKQNHPEIVALFVKPQSKKVWLERMQGRLE